jgi:hypothetical protein
MDSEPSLAEAVVLFQKLERKRQTQSSEASPTQNIKELSRIIQLTVETFANVVICRGVAVIL